jgi:predicted permease
LHTELQVNTLLRDIQYAMRGFRKQPAFVAVAILSLGLGIGANTAIFSLMDQVLLRSLPVRSPQELVLLTANGPRRGNVETSYDSDYTFSYPMYRDFRDRNPVFSAVIAWFRTSASLSFGGRTDLIRINLVSGNFFETLGVQTIMGRAINPQDDRAPGASPVAVLSHEFWVTRFGADPAILNQTLNVNNHLLTVVGVAPPGFYGVAVGETPALFVPVTMESQMLPGRSGLEKRRSMWLNVIGRLKPGVARASAEAAMNVFWRPILQSELTEIKQPSQTFQQRFLNRHLSLIPAANGISSLRSMFGAPLFLLMVLVALVLLIACANVANLMIVRAVGRRKEMAIRLALGGESPRHRPSDSGRECNSVAWRRGTGGSISRVDWWDVNTAPALWVLDQRTHERSRPSSISLHRCGFDRVGNFLRLGARASNDAPRCSFDPEGTGGERSW